MKNIVKKLSFIILAMALVWACGKDDSPTPPKDVNSAPVISAQEFTAFEGITEAQVIGTVVATDADKDALTFSIKTNDNEFFEITAAGALSLAPGKTLSFATKAQHSITVEVTDGEDAATAAITIKVTQTDPQNTAPVMADQGFSVAEDIADTEVIGTVEATDADGDDLAFEITEDVENLFEINGTTGEISLNSGKSLDFETAAEHSITVQVSDGAATTQATVTITVEDVDESLASDPNAFVTTWKTTVANEEINIGVSNAHEYDYTIDWGDGTIEEIANSDYPSHIYAEAGTYTVAILGQFPAIIMNDSFAFKNLMSLNQWGNIQWQSMFFAFGRCENMTYEATDTPDLSQVTSLSYMFYLASSFNGDIGDWDTSNVTNMTNMFLGADAFNQDISGWDTGKVTSMYYMFYGADSFNQNIGGWDTSMVTDMESMFEGATAFDQNIGAWDIGSVTNMRNMLDGCGMSLPNVNATIVGWKTYVEQNGGPDKITLGLDGLPSCPDIAVARNYLLNIWAWTFTGSGPYFQNCN